MDSKEMIGRVMERYEELKHYGFDWRSFYNGWLEGRADMLRNDDSVSIADYRAWFIHNRCEACDSCETCFHRIHGNVDESTCAAEEDEEAAKAQYEQEHDL